MATERRPLDRFEPRVEARLTDYIPYTGAERVAEIERLAEGVSGKSWANINSTFIGGGVAEILRSVVPLARSLGVDAQWYTIRGDDEFFRVTKKFHNMLQGVESEITLEEIFGAYLETIDENTQNTFVASHLVVVHDPQPAAMVMNGMIFGNILWRCHIDTSRPSPIVWRFLLPYINICAGAIFTMPEFVGPGVGVPTYQILPCVDPLSVKNRQRAPREAHAALEALFQRDGIDPQRPIIAAISRYDIHKNQATILQAFRLLRASFPPSRPPYLIFMGNTATDDPEGGAVLERLRAECGEDSDVRFWVNEEPNDEVVGALMRAAEVFVHISTREGFGLVVSEALWQGTPVIGSCVGGIPEQVIDGRTGYLVEPGDAEAVAARMAELLGDPERARALGAAGHEHVRNNFLLPELIRRYLILLRFHNDVDHELPPFRMNDLTYSELLVHARRRHPYFQELL